MDLFDRKLKVIGSTKLENKLTSLNDYIYFEFTLKEPLNESMVEMFNKLFLMNVSHCRRVAFCWGNFLFDELKGVKIDSVFWLLSKLISQTESCISEYNNLSSYRRELEFNRVSPPRLSSCGKNLIIGFNFNGYSMETIKKNNYIESVLDFIERAIERIETFGDFSKNKIVDKRSTERGIAIDELEALLQ